MVWVCWVRAVCGVCGGVLRGVCVVWGGGWVGGGFRGGAVRGGAVWVLVAGPLVAVLLGAECCVVRAALCCVLSVCCCTEC